MNRYLIVFINKKGVRVEWCSESHWKSQKEIIDYFIGEGEKALYTFKIKPK